jgi:hypothetical protein
VKVRIAGRGKQKTVRFTATRRGDSRTLMKLIEALTMPLVDPTRRGGQV